jgi:hypothetical protein
MSYLKLYEVRAAAQAYQARQPLRKSAEQILSDQVRDYTPARSYDVFLSHSREDAELILGVKAILEDNNLSVYVDWVDDPQLDRTNVTAETADVLRKRMRSCRQLVFATSQNSPKSAWMPQRGYLSASRAASRRARLLDGLIEGRSYGVPGNFIWLTDIAKGTPQRYPLKVPPSDGARRGAGAPVDS